MAGEGIAVMSHPNGFSLWIAIVLGGIFWPLKGTFWRLNVVLFLTVTAFHKPF